MRDRIEHEAWMFVQTVQSWIPTSRELTQELATSIGLDPEGTTAADIGRYLARPDVPFIHLLYALDACDKTLRDLVHFFYAWQPPAAAESTAHDPAEGDASVFLPWTTGPSLGAVFSKEAIVENLERTHGRPTGLLGRSQGKVHWRVSFPSDPTPEQIAELERIALSEDATGN